MNKKYVFSSGNRHSQEMSLSKYVMLASILMFLNYITLNYLCAIGLT